MKTYSHKNPITLSLIEKIPEAARHAKGMKLPYWLIAQDTIPLGIVIVGKEPLELLAPPGTSVAYALTTLLFGQKEAVKQFLKAGFQEFDDYYDMSCQLTQQLALTTDLRFEPIKQEEVREWFSTATRFLEGSSDTALKHALQFMPSLPDYFLNQYFSSEKLYFAAEEGKTIGILDVHTTTEWIGNMGVDPQNRRRGYGKQILMFGLNQLQGRGCRKAGLRVHVNNKPAIQLYESFSFKKAGRYRRLTVA